MKFLLVEDHENKRNQVIDYLIQTFPNLIFSIAKSFQSGLKRIIEENYDFIILDMTMPTFDISVNEPGGRPQAYAGREVLRQMERREILTPVIVLTQFDRFGEGSNSLTFQELDHQLKQAHPENYLGAVYYSVSSESWKGELISLITKAETKDI